MKTTRRMNPNLKPWKKLNLWMNPNLNLRKSPNPKLNLWMNPKLKPRKNLSPWKNLRLSLNPRQKLRLSQSLTPRLAGASFAGCGLYSGLRQGMCL